LFGRGQYIQDHRDRQGLLGLPEDLRTLDFLQVRRDGVRQIRGHRGHRDLQGLHDDQDPQIQGHRGHPEVLQIRDLLQVRRGDVVHRIQGLHGDQGLQVDHPVQAGDDGDLPKGRLEEVR